jgi:hypothetical protein
VAARGARAAGRSDPARWGAFTGAGLPAFVATPWFALFAPKGTSQPILDSSTNALDKALDDQNTQRALSSLAAKSQTKRSEVSARSLGWSQVILLDGGQLSRRRMSRPNDYNSGKGIM